MSWSDTECDESGENTDENASQQHYRFFDRSVRNDDSIVSTDSQEMLMKQLLLKIARLKNGVAAKDGCRK
jgi:hypothetical protein